MCDNEKFMQFYGNNKAATCLGSELAGDAYVCPVPSIGGPATGRAPYASCFGGESLNIGSLYHCKQPHAEQAPQGVQVPQAQEVQAVQQGGRAAIGADDSLMFAATGELQKSKTCGCGKQQGGRHHQQLGGGHNIHVNAAPMSGYYMNLDAPSVGGRPIYTPYLTEDMVVPPLGPEREDPRQFGCKQPEWNPTCH